MNDWDLLFKDAGRFEEEEVEKEEFSYPPNYRPLFENQEEYGYYGEDEKGRVVLLAVNKYDSRKQYSIREECQAIFESAFEETRELEEIEIPEKLSEIPEGCLSNAEGWAGEYEGIRRVKVNPKNKIFFSDETGLYERLPEGGEKLLLWFEKTEISIRKEVKKIGRKAFYGRKPFRFTLEEEACSYSLPGHAFFREELLKKFGKNGKVYDFSEYDGFILRNHFNPERIRMACDRLTQPLDLSEEKREKILAHLNGALPSVMETLAEKNAMEELRYLTSAGFFTKDNISEAIELLNTSNQREMLNFLMNYKHEELTDEEEFDFSI